MKWNTTLLFSILLFIMILIIYKFSPKYDDSIPQKIPEKDIIGAYRYIKFGSEHFLSSQYDIEKKNTLPVIKKNKESIGEKKCRNVLESFFKKPFLKTRSLSFLANPETNHFLELDGYNDELKLAFEYNGVQHYEFPNYTKQTLYQFLQEKRRDIFKMEKCVENNVQLIVIPYNVNDIESFILEKLKEFGY